MTAKPGEFMQKASVGLEWRDEDKQDVLNILNECLKILLQERVTLPLNVACSDILKGVLHRKRDQFSAQVTAHIHGHERSFSVQNVASVQLATLLSAIRRAIHEISHIEPLDIPEAFLYVQSAREVMESAATSLRFPEKFFMFEKELGYCGEVLVRHQSEIVFNIHAFQDHEGHIYKATDSVSATSTDPGLHMVWSKLDRIIGEIEILKN